MQFISPELVGREIREHFKPMTLIATTQSLPFYALGDRGLEILIYRLFGKQETKSTYLECDEVHLMEGVADRGRDICLMTRATLVGVIQCKNYRDRLTKPTLIREVLKFVLYLVSDGQTIARPFQYILVAPEGLTAPANALLKEFSRKIADEDIQQFFKRLQEEYVSFSSLNYSTICKTMFDFLTNIEIKLIDAIDLTEHILRHSDILRAHFLVMSVSSPEETGRVVEEKLKNYGLKMLTDSDLKILQDRIGAVTSEKRLRLLGTDLYGYPVAAMKNSKDDVIRIATKLVKDKAELDRLVLTYLNEQIRKRVYTEVTIGLLKKGKIHQFSVQMAAPYLFRQSAGAYLAKLLPPDLAKTFFKGFLVSNGQALREIEIELIETARAILSGDYSVLVGDPELINFKKNIYRHLLSGFRTITEIEQQFKKDIVLLTPTLDRILDELKQEIGTQSTVILHDVSVWAAVDYLKKSMEDIRSF